MTHSKKTRSLSKESECNKLQGKTQVEDLSVGKYKNDKTAITKEETIRTYKGFADINYITAKDPREIFEEILKVLIKQKVKIYKKRMYAISCQKQDVKFKVEVMLLEEPSGLNYVRLKKIEGVIGRYREVVGKLMLLINL